LLDELLWQIVALGDVGDEHEQQQASIGRSWVTTGLSRPARGRSALYAYSRPKRGRMSGLSRIFGRAEAKLRRAELSHEQKLACCGRTPFTNSFGSSFPHLAYPEE
jgi:hypothetical protein